MYIYIYIYLSMYAFYTSKTFFCDSALVCQHLIQVPNQGMCLRTRDTKGPRRGPR